MTVLLPSSTQEALTLLARSPVVPMAGGTDLLVHWPARVDAHDTTYVDLSGLAELRPLRWEDTALVLGGLTTYWDVIRDRRAAEEFPLLAQAARQVGAVQIQTRGTWAGNVVNASPAADGVPVLMAYGAVLTLESVRGREEVPLDAFYLDYKKMRRAPDQLITAIRLPRRHYDLAVFEKVGARRAQAITKVGIALTRAGDEWRVVANSLAPTVRRCPALERALAARTAFRGPADVAPFVAQDIAPIDDIRSTAAYRREVFARVLYHALRGRCDFVT